MMPSKRAFTLVELLVVIGIIGILAGVLFASFGGATESARAAQCLTNMRALAMAVNSRALATGYYPVAGSIEAEGPDEEDGGIWLTSKPGLISWLCEGNYDDGHGNARTKDHQSNEIFPYYGGQTDEDPKKNVAQFAITNGNIWVSSNRNKSLYTCPEHVLYRKDQTKGAGKTYFSYVMNGRFGWDYTKGAGSIAMSASGFIEYGSLGRADKTLLLAELPTVAVGGSAEDSESTGKGDSNDKLKSDCVLHYLDVKPSGGSDAVDGFAVEGSDAEAIGFVHKVGKKKRCAHIAFADGHTEKLVWAPGGVSAETLTAYLCKGWDVTFSAANGWALAQDADKVE